MVSFLNNSISRENADKVIEYHLICFLFAEILGNLIWNKTNIEGITIDHEGMKYKILIA